ncbi:MAG: CbiX/SirB N-terminal domain-containing protein [Syntrophales bacterium]|jgi:sirohydrochlorin ferrochelatase|nr:CbiX/SirB N-terminal domain-containing protein [Syntrophales bacterium]MCK9391223.1 CbiX/SirB N-terminal domain-containing protein [Syntrophales bacterium]
MKDNYSKEAVILMGHGSRVPGAGEGMEKVAQWLKEKRSGTMIEICYMSELGPHFPEILEKCVREGADKIIVMPYFLHLGIHLREDIPAMMGKEAKKYPGLTLILGRHLGFDESLAELVGKRLDESRELDDIRGIKR